MMQMPNSPIPITARSSSIHGGADPRGGLRGGPIDRMAKRRYETALLYMKMDEPQAATIYYQLLLKEFPEAAQVGKARLDMSRAYAELDQFDRAQESLDSLQLDKARAEPLSKEIEKAKADLDKSRRKFEERKARETAEARQEKL
jgi:outer membrane protein assembly factor BamD (BamD/ComL family)